MISPPSCCADPSAAHVLQARAGDPPGGDVRQAAGPRRLRARVARRRGSLPASASAATCSPRSGRSAPALEDRQDGRRVFPVDLTIQLPPCQSCSAFVRERAPSMATAHLPNRCRAAIGPSRAGHGPLRALGPPPEGEAGQKGRAPAGRPAVLYVGEAPPPVPVGKLVQPPRTARTGRPRPTDRAPLIGSTCCETRTSFCILQRRANSAGVRYPSDWCGR